MQPTKPRTHFAAVHELTRLLLGQSFRRRLSERQAGDAAYVYLARSLLGGSLFAPPLLDVVPVSRPALSLKVV